MGRNLLIEHFMRETKPPLTNNRTSPTSKDATPDSTPNHSPGLQRKVKDELSACKKWFCSSLLNHDGQKDMVEGRSTFKKFTVTNFDMNVVGPTSW